MSIWYIACDLLSLFAFQFVWWRLISDVLSNQLHKQLKIRMQAGSSFISCACPLSNVHCPLPTVYCPMSTAQCTLHLSSVQCRIRIEYIHTYKYSYMLPTWLADESTSLPFCSQNNPMNRIAYIVSNLLWISKQLLKNHIFSFQIQIDLDTQTSIFRVAFAEEAKSWLSF